MDRVGPPDRQLTHRISELPGSKLLEDHHRWTGSRRARELLDNWSESRSKFVKVFPNEYRRALGEIHARKSAVEATHKAKDSAKQAVVAGK